jgi:hypothetical protein
VARIEIDCPCSVLLAQKRELLQERSLAHSTRTEDVKNEEGKILPAYCGSEDGKFAVSSNKTGVTRFIKTVSQVAWH